MIQYKTPEQIKIMQTGGHMLAEVLREVMSAIKPGVVEIDIEQLAEKLIREKGGEPGFQKVPGYHFATCISTNDVVVHGLPGKYQFQEGDVVGVDCGVFYQGFHTDMSETVRVKGASSLKKDPTSDAVDTFLAIGKQALDEAVKVATVGNRIGNISKTIQDIVEGNGYSVVRTLIGHGVGRELHEAPEVPGFLVGKIAQTPILREGMTIAIEVIYNMGKKGVRLDKDGWTIRTTDGKLSGLFERTIAITKDGSQMLTI
jgi:methionyl aminopeptidase